MTELAFIDVVGYWLGIFLTFCILSFLYKDNPFYKFAEHLFIGVSIGYVIIQQYYNVLRPKLITRMGEGDWYLAVIPLILVLMMFTKALSSRLSWVGRYPLAVVVALYAGLQINGVTQADLGQQLKRAMADVDASKVNINEAPESELVGKLGLSPAVARAIAAQREQEPFTRVDQIAQIPSLSETDKDDIYQALGEVDPAYRAWQKLDGLEARASVHSGERFWFGAVSNLLLLLGLIASLVYFYFSVAHRGAIGKVSKVGVWVLMIGFGASFGYTVQGRISLAIGRALEAIGEKDPAIAEQVHNSLASLVSIAIIVIGIVVWEVRNKRARELAGDSDDE